MPPLCSGLESRLAREALYLGSLATLALVSTALAIALGLYNKRRGVMGQLAQLAPAGTGWHWLAPAGTSWHQQAPPPSPSAAFGPPWVNQEAVCTHV